MKILAANWWALALRGLLGVAFGLFAIVYPVPALTSLVLTFGAYTLVSGILNLLATGQTTRDRAWWTLRVQGAAGIAAGIAAFVAPALTALVLLYVIAGWAILSGALEITAAIRLRRTITGEWLLLLQGAVSILFGLLVLVAPVAGALAVVLVIGAYAFVSGLVLLALAARLRHAGLAASAPVVHRAIRRAA